MTTSTQTSLLGEFEGHSLTTVFYKEQPHWIAREVGTALGYGQEGKRLATKIAGEWKGEFVENQDFRILAGIDLQQFKEVMRLGTVPVPSRAPHLMLLSESGIYLACLKTRKPQGVRLRRFLADHILPQLRSKGHANLDDEDDFKGSRRTFIFIERRFAALHDEIKQGQEAIQALQRQQEMQRLHPATGSTTTNSATAKPLLPTIVNPEEEEFRRFIIAWSSSRKNGLSDTSDQSNTSDLNDSSSLVSASSLVNLAEGQGLLKNILKGGITKDKAKRMGYLLKRHQGKTFAGYILMRRRNNHTRVYEYWLEAALESEQATMVSTVTAPKIAETAMVPLPVEAPLQGGVPLSEHAAPLPALMPAREAKRPSHRPSQPSTEQLKAFLSAWKEEHGLAPTTPGELLTRVINGKSIDLPIRGSSTRGRARSLSALLQRYQGRNFGGLTINRTWNDALNQNLYQVVSIA